MEPGTARLWFRTKANKTDKIQGHEEGVAMSVFPAGALIAKAGGRVINENYKPTWVVCRSWVNTKIGNRFGLMQ